MGNGNGRAFDIAPGDARVVELVRPGHRVLVIGSPSAYLLRGLQERVCDIVLFSPDVSPAERGPVATLCERVIARPLSADRALAELDGTLFDAIVFDGAAATGAGIADLRPLVDHALARDGLLIGRLPPTGGDVPAGALADSGFTWIEDDRVGGERARPIYAACRLPPDQRALVEAALARQAAATTEVLTLRATIVELGFSAVEPARA
jgi:hypothetical protein